MGFGLAVAIIGSLLPETGRSTPNTYTSVAAAQPVKSCWNRGPFRHAAGTRMVDAEATLRPSSTACSTGRCPSCETNINLTESDDLACHTPLGMT